VKRGIKKEKRPDSIGPSLTAKGKEKRSNEKRRLSTREGTMGREKVSLSRKGEKEGGAHSKFLGLRT